MAEYNPYRKSMSPEEFAMKQMLMEQQQANQMQNYLGRLQYNQGQKDEEIKQRFQDIPANPRARFSSSLVSDDTYGPALSAYVGGVSVQPAIAQVNQQIEQRDAAIANLRGLYNNISRLAPDEDVVAKELEPYQQKMQMYAKDRDRYAYQKIALDAQEFAAKLNSNRTGLGAAKKNYEARAVQEEFLRKQLNEGKITAEDYNLALAIADQDYAKQGGVGKGENNVYNTYRPVMPTYVDEIEIMNKAIQGWNSNQAAGASAGLNISGQIIGTKKVNGVEGFVIRNTRKGTEEFIERGEVMNALAPVLRNDSKLQDYFRWQAKVVDYKTGDSQIANWAKRTTMSLDEQIKQTQDNLKIAQNARNLSEKEKEVNQLKIKDMQDKLEYLTQNKTTFEQALESGDLNSIRQMRQEKLVDKFNNDLVNLGTVKTDFSKVDVTEDISASEDFVYAAGLKQKQALGEIVYKQNGQLLAEPRFKDAAGYQQVKDVYDKTLQEKRKIVAEAFGQGTMLNEPPERTLEALRKLKAAEVGEQSGELAGFYVGMGKDGKKVYRAPNGAVIDGSKIEQWANEMESVASKKYYAEVRYKKAEALAMQEINSNPKLAAVNERYKALAAKIAQQKYGNTSAESIRKVINDKAHSFILNNSEFKEINNLYTKYLDANTSLESVSQSYLDILGKDGKTNYSIAAADKKSIAEYIGAKVGVNVSEGNDIVLSTEDALNFTGLKVQVEGGNYNADTPTDFKTAIESLGVQKGTQIKIGVSQVGYEQLLGDVRLVIPVTYKDTKGNVNNKTLYVNTDRNDGIWTKNVEALKNTPAMIVKRNIIKAKAEAHLGGDVKDTYENAIPIYEYGDKVRISNDGKSIYINFQGQPIRFDHEKGYRQLEAIEKAKQQQPK